ncbi:MAG TPA: hypothetical protein VID27_06020 [Blastocatellia bacterium]|jgi:hypothetical protein
MKSSTLISVLLLYTLTGGISPVWPQNERAPLRPAYPSQATQQACAAGNYFAPLVEFRERRKELLDPAASKGSFIIKIKNRAGEVVRSSRIEVKRR